MGRSGHAMQWTCAGGDTLCLRAAITAANAAPGTYADHVIVLGAGLFSFGGPDPSDPTSATALPRITGGMTIFGAGEDRTDLSLFPNNYANTRFFEVAAGGVAEIDDSFIWWNATGNIGDGGGILLLEGRLTVRRSTISHNGTAGPGAGLSNGGFMTPGHGGTVLIEASFIGFNTGDYFDNVTLT